MDRTLIKKYIDNQPQKIVTKMDLDKNKIEYQGIRQGQIVNEIKGDEEMSRSFILTRLVNELGYSPDRIEIEHEYTAGRPHTNTSRIDIVVRDAEGNAFLFIECKSPDAYASDDRDQIIEEQLYKVAGMERTEGNSVRYLVLYTTAETIDKVLDECIIIDTEKFPTFADWEVSRDFSNTLPARYGKAQKTPYIKASAKDLETDFSNEMLNQLQTDLHNVLWGGGGTDDNEVFASLTNLILAKIQDEDEKEDGDTYDFQSMTFAKDGDEEFETNEQLFERINALYRRALKSKLYILDENELQKSYVIDSKKFSLSKLKYAVQRMEGLSFVDGKNSLSGKDILGDFFEGIIRNGFKQSKGQFFTHINIVRFMLYAMQTDKLAIKRIKEDKELPYMIDPSAGSGTFLIEYMKFITKNMKYRNRNAEDKQRAGDKYTDDGFIVTNEFGHYFEQKTFKDYYDRLLKDADIGHFTFHALRRTFATHALERGMDYKTLSAILGHYSVAFTMDTYVHSMDEHKRREMDKMDDMFGMQYSISVENRPYPVLCTLSADGCTTHVPDFPKIATQATTLDAALLEVKQRIEKVLRQYKNPPIPTKQEQIVVPNNSVLVLVKAS